MKNILLLILFLISMGASAQTCYTTKRDGKLTRHVTIEFGDDTVKMGVPFKAKDKLGMTLNLREDADGRVYFSAMIRSVSPILLKDTIKYKDALFRIYLKNNDTVNVMQSRAYYGANFYTMKNFGAITIATGNYISHDQLVRIAKGELDKAYFYRDANTYADLPINLRDKWKFQHALNYLLRL